MFFSELICSMKSIGKYWSILSKGSNICHLVICFVYTCIYMYKYIFFVLYIYMFYIYVVLYIYINRYTYITPITVWATWGNHFMGKSEIGRSTRKIFTIIQISDVIWIKKRNRESIERQVTEMWCLSAWYKGSIVG